MLAAASGVASGVGSRIPMATDAFVDIAEGVRLELMKLLASDAGEVGDGEVGGEWCFFNGI